MSAWEGSAWQAAQESMNEQIAKRGRSNCGHPGCQIDDHRPQRAQECSLNGPLSISVPLGGHIHIACPAHSNGHVIMGSGVTL